MLQVGVRVFRKEWADVLGRVRYGGQRVVITRNGREVAALVPVSDLALIDARTGTQTASDGEAA